MPAMPLRDFSLITPDIETGVLLQAFEQQTLGA